jgi:glycosyltransferase involved in cell wall biosynthesis
MNVGIVSTWFERGASYVSKIFENVIVDDPSNKVFIYARGGEEYAIGDPIWDKSNVYWSKKRISPFSSTVIDKKDFVQWVKSNAIEIIIFNEQHWFQPLLWCKELNVKTVAYIDYYTEETVPLFNIYDGIICNTQRHFSVFKEFNNSFYLPWGTQIDVFSPNGNIGLVDENRIVFFHSCGWDIVRKGTDLLLKAFVKTKGNSKLIIHSQKEIVRDDLLSIIQELTANDRLEIIVKTVHAPGLYHLGDVYVYPTRLEGIGLTIAESVACGLGLVIPDQGPMNEFASEENSELIKVERLTARSDGYYWPKCEVCKDDLAEILERLGENRERVALMKLASRKFAEKKLDVQKNFSALITLIKQTEFRKADPATVRLIQEYDNKGFKRFHKYYLAFYPIFNFLRNLQKKE